MTDKEYQDIGINLLGDRKKLLKLFSDSAEQKKEEPPKQLQQELKEEFENCKKDNKFFSFRPSEPNKLLCPNCHQPVTEDSTLCTWCNKSLIISANSSSKNTENFENEKIIFHDIESDEQKITTESQKKSSGLKIMLLMIVVIAIIALVNQCFSSASSSSNNLNLTVQFKELQVVIFNNTTQDLTNVRIRLNSDYIYETQRLNAQKSYTIGVANFAKRDGTRFNPFTTKMKSLSIFSNQGSAHFTPSE